MSREDSGDAGDKASFPRSETVVQTVFGKFFAELAKVDGFADIAPRLSKIVLEEGILSEPAIRAVLFSESHDQD